MNYQNIIDQYYSEENALRRILLVHSRQVTERALRIADAHPELAIDRRLYKRQPCSTISASSYAMRRG